MVLLWSLSLSLCFSLFIFLVESCHSKGPNEHDLSLLSDKKTLIIVMRPDSDSPCPGGPPYRFYYQTYPFRGTIVHDYLEQLS